MVLPSESLDSILFDLDDTLIQYSRSSEDIFDQVYQDMGIEPAFPASAYYERYDDFLEMSSESEDHRRRCFSAAAEANGHEAELGVEIAQRYTAIRQNTGVELRPGASELLNHLSGRYSLGLVTNGSPDQQRRALDAASLDKWFDVTVFAGYDTPAKPDPDPFETALSQLESSPDRALAVGDSLSSDIAGATAAGIRSAWIPSYDQEVEDVAPDFTFQSLTELIEFL